MNRLLSIVCAGVIAVSVSARGDESQPRTDPRPPWQRVLTSDDAKQATRLSFRISGLEGAGRLAEAVKAAEELLALRTRVQGADHWETVSQKWALTALHRIAALSQDKRTGWRRAQRGDVEADNLEPQAQYGKALVLRQEILNWSREVLGE